MKHSDALILQRTADIVATIRPVRSESEPSEQFIRETRRHLLEQIMPVSLTARRRRKTLARTDPSGKQKHSA